jgi:dUTP pyrophosphatase
LIFHSYGFQVKKLTELATLPIRGSEHAAGFDLASAYDVVIPAHGKGLVKTDLAIAIPEFTYARIAPRSGLAVKKFIDTGAGVVDYDYRGNVGVVLFNHGDEDFEVKKGDRVAQLILERISMAGCEEVDELSATERGIGGFGSTGVATVGEKENNGMGIFGPATKKALVEDNRDTIIQQLLARIEALEQRQ